METLLAKLFEVVSQLQSVAPEVWAAARRQVVVLAVSDGAWGFLMIVLSIVSATILRRQVRRCLDEDERYLDRFITGSIVAGVVFFGAVIAAIGLVSSAIVMAANPDWAAIQLIMKTFIPIAAK